MNVQHKDASIQNTDDEFPGSFEVILSAPTKDRDGETLSPDEWKQPLPEHITFDADHGMSVASTVGSGVPRIDPLTGNLIVAGTYSSLPRAQEVRTLVKEGHIRTTSVAFMTEPAVMKDGRPGPKVRELLNGAFVAIPSNREAVVLSSKSIPTPRDVFGKAGARNSASDATLIQQAHDAMAALGAMCAPGDVYEGPDSKAASFTPLANGTEVSWHYRSAIGHGTIVGVHKMGTTHANTEYSIREHDHHVSESGSHEKAVVYHMGAALTVEHGKSVDDVEVKAYTAEQRRRMAKSGEALPDGSFPIANRSDLEAAIRTAGMSNAPKATVQAHIRKRAAALGLTSLIPESWKSADGVEVKDGTPDELAQGVDAALDQALALLQGVDLSTLPEPVAQAITLLQAADAASDDLLDAMDVDDPDDEESDSEESAAKAAGLEDIELKYRALDSMIKSFG